MAHDVAYWQGGTRNQRLKADEKLRDCVIAAGEPEIAKAMFAGVRVGGTPQLPTTWKWGCGWKVDRGYKALSAKELKEVDALAKKIPTNLEEVPIITPDLLKKPLNWL